MKKKAYILDKNKKYPNKDFWLFARRMQGFQKKCIDKYGKNFSFKLEVLVEWEEKCLDDITFISESNTVDIDNIIFIQVKTQGWEESEPITTAHQVYKTVKNFLINYNFQKDKHKDNISFFIFCNKNFATPIKEVIDCRWPELYLRFINYLCKSEIVDIYPSSSLNNLNKVINKKLIIDILNGKDIFIDDFLKFYSHEYLEKLTCLVRDLRTIFSNLDIIQKIDYSLLEEEMMLFYGELGFLRNERRIRDLCWKGVHINKWTPEFGRYEKYKNTYFHTKGWWKFIHELDVIKKWKFI